MSNVIPLRKARTLEQILGEIQRMESERHAWLTIAAAQIARWRSEDEANGQRWNKGNGR